MGRDSQIAWTDATWNPWQGCHKISEGCQNCYMFREKKRWGQDPDVVVRSSAKTFYAPLNWKKPRIIFTCSWSDFFIEEADPWREEALDIIKKTPHHTYLILTKRVGRIVDDLSKFSNIWLGVTVETQDYMGRVACLVIENLAKHKFISAEPLLGPLYFPLDHHHIDWVITGGESGPGARPMKPEWALSIRDQCKAAGVPFFHKQNGGNRKIDGAWGGRELDGKIYHEFPEGLRHAGN